MVKLCRAILFVKDLPRMTTFYRDGLGLSPLPDGSREGWVELGMLALHAIPSQIASGIEIADPPRPREDTPIKLCFEVEDLDRARITLAHHGAAMSDPTSWGTCDGVDLEGNVFQLVRR